MMGNLNGSDDSYRVLCGLCGGLGLLVDDLLM
jgi:hypothetical protein